MFIEIVDTFEFGTYVDRPREWSHGNLQLLLQLIKNIEGVTSLAVKLVYENDDRGFSHAAYLHQSSCLGLHALCHIDHNYDRVYGGQSAESIFREVLVTRSVEDVYLVVAIIEAHDRGRNRDASLLLDFHPVGGGCFLYFIAFNRSRHMYGTSEKQ